MATGARAAVMTVSDGVTQGTRADESGELAASMLADAGFQVAARVVVADEAHDIARSIGDLASRCDLIVTTGGTGFGPRDVTPEATRTVLDREAPGLAELMRAAGLAQTPMAALSRGLAGTVGSALVINLPGAPRGVREGLEAVLPVVPHAIELLAGARGRHPTGHPAERPPQPDVPTGGSSPSVRATAVKVHGDPPCRVGASMSIVPGGEVHGTLGCAEFDAAAVDAASDVAAAGAPEVRTLTHDLGEIEVYFEPRDAVPDAIVVSATDVARALRSHLEQLGYRVLLVEPRRERVTTADAPVVSDLRHVPLGERSVVVLTDHDAPAVTETLTTALRSSARFIGVMGSRRHVGRHVEALREAGFDDDEIARVRSPLGLDLGGRDPESIALSIAAGVVADEHGRDGGWLDR
ncbi:MAG: molybdenum cofactor synthesis domain-containing protein [Actinomycetota bacterium]